MASNDLNSKVQINYLSRSFSTVRQDLVNYIQLYYPDQWQDMNVGVNSVGGSLLDLQAYTADLLSYSIDKRYNELYLDGIKERTAAYRLAKTMGFKIVGNRPSVGLVDITIDVPATADGPDQNYLPLYRSGLRVSGLGQIFETEFDVDFSSDFSEEGIANKITLPILDGNQNLLKYQITKREKIKAGVTKIVKVEVPVGSDKDFYEYVIKDADVLEILDICVLPKIGSGVNATFQDFDNPDYKFYEVDYLAADSIFIQDPSIEAVGGIKTGIVKEITKKFITESLPNGGMKITFGNGTPGNDPFGSYVLNINSNSAGNALTIADLLDNISLGERIMPNSTIFIKARYGGGSLSNVGTGVLQSVSEINAVMLGNNQSIKQNVISSTRATNPIPTSGGAGMPSVEEIRYSIPKSFAAQQRCVVMNDYISRVYQIPGKFGAPFRVHGKVDENKIKLFILSQDGNGKLVLSNSNIIKNNIEEYLSMFRTINDFVEINDGKFINLQVEADLLVNKSYNKNEVKLNAINIIGDFLNINKWQMNETIYVSQISDLLSEIPGVVNVVDIRFYNAQNGANMYSNYLCQQADLVNGESLGGGAYRYPIQLIDNAIFSTEISMFEIRFPEKDIRIRTA